MKKPDWLKVKLQNGAKTQNVNNILGSLSLNTVCSEANCPNKMECFERGTATFMILGKNCTRNCRFCNVTQESPEEVNLDEAKNVAMAVKKLKLRHAVITSVTRDDLADQGANQFARVVNAIRLENPNVTIELLIPDMQGKKDCLDIVLSSNPEVLNHNIETVKELYFDVRPMADFKRSLEVLEYSKKIKPKIYTKSGLMLGLGEKSDQVVETLKCLRSVDCDILTLGQYLQPSSKHIKVKEYVSPAQFDEYKAIASDLGFKSIASAPLVRSSYFAENLIDSF